MENLLNPGPELVVISYCLRATEMLVQMRCLMLRCCEGERQGYESCPVTLELLVI